MQPAVLTGTDVEPGVVCGGDCRDDRQAEAEPLAMAEAIGRQALERLEQPLDRVGRHVRPGVGDRERGPAVERADVNVNVSAGDVVVDRVLKQVRYQAGDQPAITEDGRRLDGHVDVEVTLVGLCGDALDRIIRDRRQIGGFAMVESALALGEREQGIDQLLLLLALLERLRGRFRETFGRWRGGR